MGNAALRELSDIESVSLDDFSGRVLAIDAHNWLYKYLTITVRYTDTSAYTTADGVELPAVLGCMKGLPRFYEHNIIPIFVFDGSYHSLKEEEIQRRKSKKQDAQQKYETESESGDIVTAAKYDSRSTRLTPEMITSVQKMLDILNIEYVEAPQAGETQAAYMTQETPAVYGCASDDYDSLLFGANYTIRNLSSPDDLEMISLDKTLSNLELTRAELVDVAILCGTDYNDGVYGYGPKTSVTTVQNNEAETVFKENNVNYKKLRELFLNPKTTEINTVQNTLPNPNISELETYLYSLDFSEDTIGAALERIRSNTEQPELSKWT